jgi:hypothetical protein
VNAGVGSGGSGGADISTATGTAGGGASTGWFGGDLRSRLRIFKLNDFASVLLLRRIKFHVIIEGSTCQRHHVTLQDYRALSPGILGSIQELFHGVPAVPCIAFMRLRRIILLFCTGLKFCPSDDPTGAFGSLTGRRPINIMKVYGARWMRRANLHGTVIWKVVVVTSIVNRLVLYSDTGVVRAVTALKKHSILIDL